MEFYKIFIPYFFSAKIQNQDGCYLESYWVLQTVLGNIDLAKGVDSFTEKQDFKFPLRNLFYHLGLRNFPIPNIPILIPIVILHRWSVGSMAFAV
jgi:hypothetical protein